ncbi:Hint domain-containing protein [Litoreibacter meonggei]|uniref:Hint domain-containing protein n=1 Tax=Litoreibacter meonggei TaxID=1049199 RepID=A0A497X4R6_9RHOB|nr:Hint domain-containing protein [Litoreibacter meonggei]RLJ60200.1 Hint domain-containing protein [Litoreibacter meonggei]
MADYSFHTYAPDVLVFSGGTFTLSSSYDFRTDRNLVEYRDDDSQFDGSSNGGPSGADGNQTGSAYNDQGDLIEAGDVYVRAYAELQAPDGTVITIDRIEVDGVHVGYVPSQPLVPGAVYNVTFSQAVTTSNSMGHSYYAANSVPCFDANTRIETADGSVLVCDVMPGQLVMTLDHGLQPVRWRCDRRVDLRRAEEADLPVLIPAGALGAARPMRDLIVSAQHRMLLGHRSQAAALAPRQTLVPAKALIGQVRGVRYMRGRRVARWVHLAFERHQIVTVNGAYSESLLLGRVCLNGLLPTQRNSLERLIANGEIQAAAPARPCLGVSAARRMMGSSRLRPDATRLSERERLFSLH